MSTRVAAGLVCMLFLWSTSASAQVVESPGRTDYTVVNGDAAPQVTVPLVVTSGTAALEVRVARVMVADRPRPDSLSGFTVGWDATGNRLLVSLQSSPAVRLAPGTYHVDVEVSGSVSGANPPARARQIVPLLLTIPAARLKAIPAIKIIHTRIPFGQSQPSRELELVEIGMVTKLTGLTIHQVEPAASDDWQVEAKFEADLATRELPAGGEQRVMLTGHDFPIGDTRGTLAIEADQLEQPILVPFEVRTRLCSFTICLIFFVAGLLGWYVRHHLKTMEERAVVENQLAPITRRAEAIIAKHPDGAQDVMAANKAVAEALRQQGDVAGLQAKVDALRLAIDAFSAGRLRRLNEGLKTVAELQTALATPWDLPAVVLADVATLRVKTSELEQILQAEDLERADSVGGGLAEVIEALRARLAEWARGVRPVAQTFVTPPSTMPLPAAARAEATRAAQAAVEKLDALAQLQPGAGGVATPPTGALSKLLETAHGARAQLRKLTDAVVPIFESEAGAVIAALRHAGQPEDVLAPLAAAAKVSPNDDPAALAGAARDALVSFAQAFRVLLSSAEARAKLDAGQYLDAASLATQTDGRAIAAFATVAGRAVARPSATAAPTVERVIVSLLPAPRALDPVVVATERLARIRILRGVIVAVVMAGAAWAVYHDKWIGTWNDIVGVAVVAFFSDFTIDAAADAVGKLRKPT